MQTSAQRALYNNLGKSEALALAVDAAVNSALQDGWRDNAIKTRKVRLAIEFVLAREIPNKFNHAADPDANIAPEPTLEQETDRILALVKNQRDY